MRNLIRNSILLCCLGCSPSPYAGLQKEAAVNSCLSAFKPNFSSVLYNAQVNVAGNHMSGLLLFKTMPDSTIRVIFTSEMGVTFFDFEYVKENFRVVAIQEKMNKKVVINSLRKDIGLLLMPALDSQQQETFRLGNELYFRVTENKENTFYITDTSCSSLKRIETASKRKQKIQVNLTGYQSGMPDSVYLAHHSFEYNITLKQITR